MGVSGFGIRVTGTYISPIRVVDEKGMSDTNEVFPAPDVIFSSNVHTNSDGLRVVIERNACGIVSSILVWSDELPKIVSVSYILDTLRNKLVRNNEDLIKEFKSWVGEGVT